MIRSLSNKEKGPQLIPSRIIKMASAHSSGSQCPLCKILGETKMILVEEKGVLKLRLETEDIQATMKEQMAKCYGNRQDDILRRCIK